jgi:hypothetical protein
MAVMAPIKSKPLMALNCSSLMRNLFVYPLLLVMSLMPDKAFAAGGTQLMTFTQRDNTQYVRFNDSGPSSSKLVTYSNGVLGGKMDVDFTFTATNALYTAGTTVQGKFTFSAIALGPYSTFGGPGSFPRFQAIDQITFSFTNVTGSVNFLSGTAGVEYLSQYAGNTAYLDVYQSDSLMLTSDAYGIDALNDATQFLRLNFSPLTPAFFADSNSNTVLDTINMNVTGYATATPTTVVAPPQQAQVQAPQQQQVVLPEPSSAVLTLVSGCVAFMRRRR